MAQKSDGISLMEGWRHMFGQSSLLLPPSLLFLSLPSSLLFSSFSSLLPRLSLLLLHLLLLLPSSCFLLFAPLKRLRVLRFPSSLPPPLPVSPSSPLSSLPPPLFFGFCYVVQGQGGKCIFERLLVGRKAGRQTDRQTN